MPVEKMTYQDFINYQKRGLLPNTVFSNQNLDGTKGTSQSNKNTGFATVPPRPRGGCSGCGGR